MWQSENRNPQRPSRDDPVRIRIRLTGSKSRNAREDTFEHGSARSILIQIKVRLQVQNREQIENNPPPNSPKIMMYDAARGVTNQQRRLSIATVGPRFKSWRAHQ